jgi:hypothetical protein
LCFQGKVKKFFGNKHYQDQDFKAMKLSHNPMGIDQLSFHRLWFALG